LAILGLHTVGTLLILPENGKDMLSSMLFKCFGEQAKIVCFLSLSGSMEVASQTVKNSSAAQGKINGSLCYITTEQHYYSYSVSNQSENENFEMCLIRNHVI